jgi:hypothetical protein
VSKEKSRYLEKSEKSSPKEADEKKNMMMPQRERYIANERPSVQTKKIDLI